MDEQIAKPEDLYPIIYNKDRTHVVQANSLIRAKKDELSLFETKLLKLVIAQVVMDDKDFKTYSCSVSKLADILGMDPKNVYREVDSLTDDLLTKRIYMRQDEENVPKYSKKSEKADKPFYKLTWVSLAQYENGVLTIKLNENLAPYLRELKKLFTDYDYIEILNLPTANSISLFELLYSYSNMKFRTYTSVYNNIQIDKDEVCFDIEYLREYFNCENSYPNNSDFVKRVISASIDRINKHTIFPCSFRLIRSGRKITHIVFKLGDEGARKDHSLKEFLSNDKS